MNAAEAAGLRAPGRVGCISGITEQARSRAAGDVALAALGRIGSAGVRKPVSIMCRSMMSPIAATSDPT